MSFIGDLLWLVGWLMNKYRWVFSKMLFYFILFYLCELSYPPKHTK